MRLQQNPESLACEQSESCPSEQRNGLVSKLFIVHKVRIREEAERGSL